MTTAFVISYFPFVQVTVKIIMLSLGLFALLSLELYQRSSIELNFSFHDQSVVILRLGGSNLLRNCHFKKRSKN